MEIDTIPVWVTHRLDCRVVEMASQSDNFVVSDEFINALRRRDKLAWEQIYHKYRAYLFAVASRTLKMDFRAGECSSIVQGGFARALERIEQFRGRTQAELQGWLSRIVSNLAIERIRGPEPGPIPIGSNGSELLP